MFVIVNYIRLKNFRCFDDYKLDLKKRFVFIQGNNGSGKTSLLEAIYYSCYVKSFRTRFNTELINFDKKHFFVQVEFDESDTGHKIQAGFSQKDGKLIKLNDKPIKSYKEIASIYKVINVAENDLSIVNQGPSERRTFLNQSLFLLNSDYVFKLRKYKQILDQRNAFLLTKMSLNNELLAWTNQLWELSLEMQEERKKFLRNIEIIVNKLLYNYFDDLEINFFYNSKNIDVHNFEEFWKFYKDNIYAKEAKWRRSLFGLHLDDFSISFKQKKARIFASRGQQKLILLLLKIAQILALKNKSDNLCLLIDDFFTDFDKQKIRKFFSIFNDLKCQIFITSPMETIEAFLDIQDFDRNDFQVIKLIQ
ncbi:DNA replication and repair protein RecF [Candidatus Dependentiae bacterium]|nr:DNA replication and repair protein RecF [Candidatus Dependentiae bacterium]